MKKLALLLSTALCLNSTAQFNHVQVMHNSADTSVKNLKLWINDTVWVQQFNYLMSTPQVSLGAGVHTIGVSLPNATSQSQSIAQATLDNSNTNYSFAFLAVVGIHDTGPQYNPGASQKPFGIYTHTLQTLLGEPSPWDVRFLFSHLSTDITSVTVVSGTTSFASSLGYRQTNSYDLFGASQFPNGLVTYTVLVSSPSGSLGTGTITVQSGKKTSIVTSGFNDTLVNARMAGGGKKLVLGVVPAQGGKVTEVVIKKASTAGISEANAEDELQLLPNPANDMVSIVSTSKAEISYTVFDLNGRQLLKGKFRNSVRIDTSELAAGTYMVRCEAGDKSFTKRLLIER